MADFGLPLYSAIDNTATWQGMWESREFVRSIIIRGGEVPGEVGIND
jgi:hypothetical protein